MSTVEGPWLRVPTKMSHPRVTNSSSYETVTQIMNGHGFFFRDYTRGRTKL